MKIGTETLKEIANQAKTLMADNLPTIREQGEATDDMDALKFRINVEIRKGKADGTNHVTTKFSLSPAAIQDEQDGVAFEDQMPMPFKPVPKRPE